MRMLSIARLLLVLILFWGGTSPLDLLGQTPERRDILEPLRNFSLRTGDLGPFKKLILENAERDDNLTDAERGTLIQGFEQLQKAVDLYAEFGGLVSPKCKQSKYDKYVLAIEQFSGDLHQKHRNELLDLLNKKYEGPCGDVKRQSPDQTFLERTPVSEKDVPDEGSGHSDIGETPGPDVADNEGDSKADPGDDHTGDDPLGGENGSDSEPNDPDHHAVNMGEDTSAGGGGDPAPVPVPPKPRKAVKTDAVQASQPDLPIQEIKITPVQISFFELLEDQKLPLSDKDSIQLEFISKGSFKIGISSEGYREMMNYAGVKIYDMNIANEVVTKGKRNMQITEPFFIGTFEVSNRQFKTLVPNFQYDAGKENMPATGMRRAQLKRFLERLNKQFPKLQIDLPTEIEWEFAAKGNSEVWYTNEKRWDAISKVINVGTDSLWQIHSDSLSDENKSWTGTFQMIGNAKELTHPIQIEGIYLNPDPKNFPYVARGGSFREDEFAARTTTRHFISDPSFDDIGLRLVIRKPQK